MSTYVVQFMTSVEQDVNLLNLCSQCGKSNIFEKKFVESVVNSGTSTFVSWQYFHNDMNERPQYSF